MMPVQRLTIRGSSLSRPWYYGAQSLLSFPEIRVELEQPATEPAVVAKLEQVRRSAIRRSQPAPSAEQQAAITKSFLGHVKA
jgi:hypothetical protein